MKLVIVFIGLFFLSFNSFSQASDNLDPNVYFGFSFGLNYTNSSFSQTDWTSSSYPFNDSISSISNGNGIGFRLGLLMEAEITERLSMSPKIELSFNEDEIVFDLLDETQRSFKVNPVTAEFISHFMFKFPDTRVKPYLIAGPNLKVPTLKDGAFKTKSFDLAVDFGIGIEKYFPNFCFAPELRYSRGLMNVDEQHPGYFNSAVRNVVVENNFSLVLIFKN